MKDTLSGLTADRLREVVVYDPETGRFTWRVTMSATAMAGGECGDIKRSGYRLIGVDGNRYRAHRLAWLYMTGEWPPDQIDHANGVRSDNRWANLRPATAWLNSYNRGANRNSSHGIKGVHRYRNRSGDFVWRAKINVGPRQVHLGSFKTPEEAGQAYLAAAAELVGQYARA